MRKGLQLISFSQIWFSNSKSLKPWPQNHLRRGHLMTAKGLRISVCTCMRTWVRKCGKSTAHTWVPAGKPVADTTWAWGSEPSWGVTWTTRYVTAPETFTHLQYLITLTPAVLITFTLDVWNHSLLQGCSNLSLTQLGMYAFKRLQLYLYICLV